MYYLLSYPYVLLGDESTLVYSSAVISNATSFTTLSSMNNPILVTSSTLLYMSSITFTHDDSSSVVSTSTSSFTVITVTSSTSAIDITMLTTSIYSITSSVNTSSQGQNNRGTDTTYIISGVSVTFLVMITIVIISVIACIVFVRQSKQRKGKILNNEFYGL